MTYKWHIPDLNEIEKKLDTDLSGGLSSREARTRLERESSRRRGNIPSLFVPERKTVIQCLTSLVMTPGVLLLIIVSLLTAIFGRAALGATVLAVTLIGAAVGGFIELSSARRLDKMAEYASPMVKVKRGGSLYHTDGRNIVRGDVVYLSVGDIMPCDARLISASDIEVDEIYWNGKRPCRRRVEKDVSASYGESGGILAPNAKNMLYAGSVVVSGSAVAVVTDVFDDTYLSEYLPCGSLASGEREAEGARLMNPFVYKTVFFASAALLLLSMISLLTLQNVDFICVFLMLLSSVSLLSTELLSLIVRDVLSYEIKRAAEEKNKKSDRSVAIRGVKALDRLTGVTDLVLIGGVALGDGIARVRSVYTSDGVSEEMSIDNICHARIMTCIHTYIKALNEGNIDNDFAADGYPDALIAYIKERGFDVSGNSLAIKSLYFAGSESLGYACAETASETYRTVLTFESDIIGNCTSVRVVDGLAKMDNAARSRAFEFIRRSADRGEKCLTVVSDSDGNVTLEGILSLGENLSSLNDAVNVFGRLGIDLTLFLPDRRMADRVLAGADASSVLSRGVAYPETLLKNTEDICDLLGKYSVFVGFDADDYCRLIDKMKNEGKTVASFGVDNDHNEIMARADISVSCDTLKYSSDRYRDAVYERMTPSGRDTNLRCSQQTRLLSRVIVKRENSKGGGLSSFANAVIRSRSAYVSLTQSILLFVYLYCGFLGFAVMSSLTGNMLLDPLQSVALATVFALLSVTAFKGSDTKSELLRGGVRYAKMPIDTVVSNKIGIIARASLAAFAAITVKILDAVKVFGENATYTLPIYICLMLTLFAEVFLINRKYTRNGEGRRYCWMRVLISYAALLCVPALATQNIVAGEFYPNGFGSLEFLIVPAYVVLYFIMHLTVYLIERSVKKTK